MTLGKKKGRKKRKRKRRNTHKKGKQARRLKYATHDRRDQRVLSLLHPPPNVKMEFKSIPPFPRSQRNERETE